jgi:RES domain
MVTQLQPPARPLKGGHSWTWHPEGTFQDEDDARQSRWVRIFHHGQRCPAPDTRRSYGPLARFDHHTVTDPVKTAGDCPQGRSIIYLAKTLGTALVEVFGDLKEASICPNFRVAAMHIDADCRVQDLTGVGCMSIDALPSLATGDVERPLTQEWARAIYDDEPADSPISGVLYTGAHDEGLCLGLFDRAPSLRMVADAVLSVQGRPLLDMEDRVLCELSKRGLRFKAIDTKDCQRCR